MPRGRPRLAPRLRLRIMQIRASHAESPPSIDKILDRMAQEGIDPLPARGTVASVIREWEELPELVRWQESPFRWDHPDRADVPWEASHWIRQCSNTETIEMLEIGNAVKGIVITDVGDPPKVLKSEHSPVDMSPFVRFTNRLAKWCWRIHLAAPDLLPKDVLGLASIPATEEATFDLTGIRVEIQDLNDWLALRPDLEARAGLEGSWKRYWVAVEVGLVAKPIPKTLKEAEARFRRSIKDLRAAGLTDLAQIRNVPGIGTPVELYSLLSGKTFDALELEEDEETS